MPATSRQNRTKPLVKRKARARTLNPTTVAHGDRMVFLKDLDVDVQNQRKILEYFKTAELTNSQIAREFVSNSKKSMKDLLRHLFKEGKTYGFSELQMRSILIFFKKAGRAKTVEELLEALEYFNQCSCILKLPNPKPGKN